MEEVIGSIPIRSTNSSQQLSKPAVATAFSSNPRFDPISLTSSRRDLDRIKELRLCRHLRSVDTVGVQRGC